MPGQLFLKYKDGCDLWHHCLSCPLPACQYDVPVSPNDKHQGEITLPNRTLPKARDAITRYCRKTGHLLSVLIQNP